MIQRLTTNPNWTRREALARCAAALRPMLPAAALLVAFVLLPSLGFAQITDDDIATLFDDAAGETTAGNSLAKGPSLAEMLVKMTIALAVVLGLMAGGMRLMRRYVPKSQLAGKGNPIRVLANHSLGQRRSVMMVRVQDKTLVLGVTPHNITCLSELDDQDYDQWHTAAQQAALAAGDPPPDPPRGFGGTTDFSGGGR